MEPRSRFSLVTCYILLHSHIGYFVVLYCVIYLYLPKREILLVILVYTLLKHA